MENHQAFTADKILERVASDKALHDVLQPLLEEVRQLRNDIREMRETIAATAPAQYLTVRELAETLQVSYETVRRRVAAGEWPAVMIGRHARFGPEELAAIRKRLSRPVHDPPMSSWERRQRNKRLRNLFPAGG
ncbi:excisionase family DNA-binding protein [Pseudarthrobacter sp. 1C304]|uniref:excisionase family DNA-binding protein n=1 Tax=Pseudarthrobacter sp. 1C304 TaxID=3457438 RepID=UPI003FCFAE19